MNPQQWTTFAWGCAGSLAVEVVELHVAYRAGKRIPARYRKVGFWLTRTALALIGGGVAVAYGAEQPLHAATVGAAAPLIVERMAKALPD